MITERIESPREKTSAKRKALAAVTACVLFWGFSFISIKIAVEVFPPMTLGAMRFAIALVFLFFIKKKYAPNEKIKREDIPLLAGAGLTGVTLYFFFENNGVSLVPASEASIIIGAVPVITLISEALGKIILPHKKTVESTLRPRKLLLPAAGALLSMAGVALVAGISFALSGTAKGYVYMAGACVSWVAYCFLTRPLFARRSRIYIVFWQSFAGFLGFLPFVFFETPGAVPGLYVWAHVLFLGIFCSALGYWFYSMALQVLGVAVASMFINFVPVISAIGGFFILGERLKPLQWFGAVLVLVGVTLAMLPGKRSDKEKKRGGV